MRRGSKGSGGKYAGVAASLRGGVMIGRVQTGLSMG